MEKMDNKTDRYFRERLGNFEQSPPDAAWESINAKMESRKKRRAMLIFFRIAAGMAILISAGIGLYYIGNKDGRPTDITARVAEPLQEENKSLPVSKDALSENSSGTEVSNERNGSDEREHRNETDFIARGENLSGVSTSESYLKEEQTDLQSDDQIVQQTSLQKDQQIEKQTVQDFSKVIAQNEDLPAMKDSELISTARSSDTSLTPEQATAVLLAMNNSEEKEPSEKTRRWTIGSEIAPLYSNRSINSESLYNSTLNNLNSSETGILAYAGGIRVAVNAGKRITVQSGIYYSRYGQQINEVHTVAGTQGGSDSYKFIAASNSTGTIEGVISARSEAGFEMQSYDKTGVFYSSDIRNGIANSELKPLVEGDAQSIQLKQYFDYFELPLIVRYKVIDRKWDFSFSGGLITNFMVGNSVNLITDGDSKTIGETSDINEINYLGSFGLGMEMPLAGNFSISLEPRFRYYINSFDRSELISVHPYSFGFFAGVNYRF